MSLEVALVAQQKGKQHATTMSLGLPCSDALFGIIWFYDVCGRSGPNPSR